MEFFNTLAGTFVGAFLAFIFNNWKEQKREENNEKSALYETKDIIKNQKTLIIQIESIFLKNYEANKIPLFLSKDSIDIKDKIDNSNLDWLKYGELIEYFTLQEINLEKIIFLISKRSNGGYCLLNKIRRTAVLYQEIKNLIVKRRKTFFDLDIFYSEHTIQELFKNTTNFRKINDLLVSGDRETVKLMDDLKISQEIFNECIKDIDEYIKKVYIETCILTKIFFS